MDAQKKKIKVCGMGLFVGINVFLSFSLIYFADSDHYGI